MAVADFGGRSQRARRSASPVANTEAVMDLTEGEQFILERIEKKIDRLEDKVAGLSHRVSMIVGGLVLLAAMLPVSVSIWAALHH